MSPVQIQLLLQHVNRAFPTHQEQVVQMAALCRYSCSHENAANRQPIDWDPVVLSRPLLSHILELILELP